MRHSANVGPIYLTSMFTFHSSSCSVILNAFFYMNKVKSKLTGIFVRIYKLSQKPLHFFEMPTWYLDSAQLIVHLHSAIEATFQQRCVIAGGEEKEENVFYVNLVAASMIACSVLPSSVRSCSLILAGNSDKPETDPRGCTSWRLLTSHSLLDTSLQKSI